MSKNRFQGIKEVGVCPCRSNKPLDSVYSWGFKTKEISANELPDRFPCIVIRPVKSQHAALYIGNGLVIHYFPDENSRNVRELSKSSSTTKIRVDTIERFLMNEKMYYEVININTGNPYETIALALLNLGRQNWGLFNENCHHFALFCMNYPTYGDNEGTYLLSTVDEWGGSFFLFFQKTISTIFTRSGNFLVFNEENTKNYYLDIVNQVLQAKTKEEVYEIIAKCPDTTKYQSQGFSLKLTISDIVLFNLDKNNYVLLSKIRHSGCSRLLSIHNMFHLSVVFHYILVVSLYHSIFHKRRDSLHFVQIQHLMKYFGAV